MQLTSIQTDRQRLQIFCISYKIRIGTKKKKWDQNKAGLLLNSLMAQWKRGIVSSVAREPCRLVVFRQWQNTVTKHDSLTAGITTNIRLCSWHLNFLVFRIMNHSLVTFTSLQGEFLTLLIKPKLEIFFTWRRERKDNCLWLKYFSYIFSIPCGLRLMFHFIVS